MHLADALIKSKMHLSYTYYNYNFYYNYCNTPGKITLDSFVIPIISKSDLLIY